MGRPSPAPPVARVTPASRLDDPARLAAIEKLSSSGGRDERFDRVVRLARRLFDVPVVAVNLIDDQQQVSLAQVGLDSSVRPVSESICATAVEEGRSIDLPDARLDPVFSQHPTVVSDDPVVFYAGRLLHCEGEVVGTLCLAAGEPRHLTDGEHHMLDDLVVWVEQELAKDRDQREAVEVQRRLLPRHDVQVPGLEVAGYCEPARTVGGDFYDWQVLDGRLQVVLADVMGKGLWPRSSPRRYGRSCAAPPPTTRSRPRSRVPRPTARTTSTTPAGS